MHSNRPFRRCAGILVLAGALSAAGAARAACTSVMTNATTAYVACSAASDQLTVWEAFGSWVHSATFGTSQFDWDTGAAGEQDLPPGSTINVSFAGGGGTLVIGTSAVPADSLNGVVTLTSGGSAATVSVTIDASASTTGRLYTIDDGAGSSSVGALVFKDGAAAGVTLNIVAGTGADSFGVLSVAAADAVFVQGSDGADSVSFADASSMQGIKGSIEVRDAGNWMTLLLDDSADVVGRSAVLGGDDLTATLSGLAPGQIRWATTDVALIGMSLSSGADHLSIQYLANPAGKTQLYVDGENGADVVTIGGAADGAQGIFAPVSVVSSNGLATLKIDDANDDTGRNATVHAAGELGYAAGFAPATIDWDAASTVEVDVLMGAVNDTVVVQSTNTPLKIDGGDGADTVTLGFAGSVQDITAPVDVSNHSAFSTLTIDDSNDATGRSIVVSADGTESKVVGIAPAPISWRDTDFTTVTLRPGTGDDALTVGSLDDNPDRSDFQLAIHSAGGSDSVTLGSGGSVQGVKGAVYVANDALFSALTIDDSFDAVPSEVSIGATGVTRLTAKPITWNAPDVDSVSIKLGSGGNLAHLLGTNDATPTTTTLNLGAGPNLCFVDGAGLGAASTNNVVGGSSDDVFVVSAVPFGVESLTIYGGGQSTAAGDEIVYTSGSASGAFPGNGTLTPTQPGVIAIDYVSIERFSVDDTLFWDRFE